MTFKEKDVPDSLKGSLRQENDEHRHVPVRTIKFRRSLILFKFVIELRKVLLKELIVYIEGFLECGESRQVHLEKSIVVHKLAHN